MPDWRLKTQFNKTTKNSRHEIYFNKEVESLKRSKKWNKTQIKNSGIIVKNSEESFTNRLEQMEERISGHEIKLEERITQ